MVLDNFCNSSSESIRHINKISGRLILFIKSDIGGVETFNQIFDVHIIDAVLNFARHNLWAKV